MSTATSPAAELFLTRLARDALEALHEVVYVFKGDAAASDVDDARRVRELLVIVVLASALLECFSLVFDILLGECGTESQPSPNRSLIFSLIRCAPLVGPRW